ncbi:MAG TPA: hypothetical protein VJQ46_15765 [Gemmatimonadales bacterium]|nr:hypothetical protein [Gemmatimonadales bacterium]
MSRSPRFICTDPDAGDLEFADVEAVLDALEAALVQPTSALFDVARQSWQPLGVHPEIRGAWEDRLRYRPATPGLGLPPLPSVTALVRSLPEDDDGLARRREAFARVRAAGLPPRPPSGPPRDRSRRYAAMGLAWALVLLAVVGWAIVTFASRLSAFAASVVSFRPR